MGMIAAQRMTAALLGGSMSTAQLETMLNTRQGLAAWKLCAATDALARPLATDPAARAVWLASTKAMDAMAPLSEYGAAVIAGDSTLMASVFNTAARADAWFASDTTRAAIWTSDKALTALAGSATGKARARACAKYTVHTMPGSGSEQTFPAPMGTPGDKFILIGWGTNAGGDITISGRRESSAVGSLAGNVGSSTTAALDNIVALLGPVKANIANGFTGYFGAVRV